MPYPTRIKAATLAAVLVAARAACGSGHTVTHFNIPLTSEGYTYANGLTVVIAYVAPGSPPATVEDALTEILDNLR